MGKLRQAIRRARLMSIMMLMLSAPIVAFVPAQRPRVVHALRPDAPCSPKMVAAVPARLPHTNGASSTSLNHGASVTLERMWRLQRRAQSLQQERLRDTAVGIFSSDPSMAVPVIVVMLLAISNLVDVFSVLDQVRFLFETDTIYG